MNQNTANKKIGRQTAEITEQTKRVILEAALRVFSKSGFDGVSLRNIATEAGTTHGLIRHHFGTKEEVWQAAVDIAVARYTAAISPYTDNAEGEMLEPLETAKTVVHGFIKISARNPEVISLITHEGANSGRRIEYILSRFAPLGAEMKPLLDKLHELGYLRQFNNQTFFLFLLTSGAVPFALPAVTNRVIESDIASDEQIEKHIKRILETLF